MTNNNPSRLLIRRFIPFLLFSCVRRSEEALDISLAKGRADDENGRFNMIHSLIVFVVVVRFLRIFRVYVGTKVLPSTAKEGTEKVFMSLCSTTTIIKKTNKL
jgi:hypothetical protein